MDSPDPGRDQLWRALQELTIINRFLDGYGPVWRGLQSLLPSCGSFRVLDVGTGAGDVPAYIVDRSTPSRSFRVLGIDLLEDAVEYAKQHYGHRPSLNFEQKDLFDMDPETTRFDAVISSMTFHHFYGEELVRALRNVFRLSRYGVVLVDLHRHPFAYGFIRTVTALFSSSDMVRHDAPLSVRRGFTREELFQVFGEAGLPAPVIRWNPGFRWSAVANKE